MSIRVGGARQQPAAVRHIAKCQNPHCGNNQLTRLVDYVKCNVCGWDTRMNAQDVLDKFGPYPAPKVEIPVSASGEDAHHSTPNQVGIDNEVVDSCAGMPSSADLDAVAAETKAADDTNGDVNVADPRPPEQQKAKWGKKQRG